MKLEKSRATEIFRLAIAIVILLALSIGMPFSGYQLVTAGLIVLCGAFLIITARKKFAVVIAFFLLFGLVSTDTGLGSVAVILSIIVGTGLCAHLFDKTASPFVAVIPVLGFTVATVITGDPLGSIMSLGYLLPSIALALGFKHVKSRVGAICTASAAVLVGIAALGAVLMYRATGTLSLSQLSELAQGLKASFAEMLLSLEVPISATETQRLFTRLEAQNMASSIVSLAPALLIIFCNAIAFFSQIVLYNLVIRSNEPEKLEQRAYIEMSAFAGVIFILSFFISAIVSPTGDGATVSTVCENIFIILIPGLAISGFTHTVFKLMQRRRGGGFPIFLFIFLLFFNVASALLFAACIGAYHSIATPLTVYLRSRHD